MAIVKRFRGTEGEVPKQCGCLCKSRGVPSDYPDGVPDDFTPDEDDSIVPGKQFIPDNHPTTNNLTNNRSVIDKMTLGDIVDLINYLIKEVNDIKKRMG